MNVESYVPEPTHIRMQTNAANICFGAGGSISLSHFAEQRDHADTLPLCNTCLAYIDKYLPERVPFPKVGLGKNHRVTA